MAEWYIKALSELAGISVRTLRHYDEIGLLKPSVRRSNGYRLYSEADLSTLQLIKALKHFGFGLQEIKKLLDLQGNPMDYLQFQKRLLDEQIVTMQRAAACLNDVITHVNKQQCFDLTMITTLFEVYTTMIDDLKKSWAGKVFTDEQLTKYAKMQQEQGPNSPEEQAQYGRDWETLVSEVGLHVNDDPYGPIGQEYAKKWMNLVGRYWKDRELGEAIWNAYKEDKVPTDPAKSKGWPVIPKSVVEWIDKAVYFMYSGQKK